MISLDNIPADISNIPSEWIFEYYCNLDVKLKGQIVTINSLFNDEKTPSMKLFVFENNYIFKDFSSGKGGSGLYLVSQLFNLTESEASIKILNDYNNLNRKPKSITNYKVESYKFEGYKSRNFNGYDIKYWNQYGITTKELDYYNVKPLKYVTYSKMLNSEIVNTFNIEKGYMYGYFKKDGTLYKVYNPKNENKKFMKIKDYLQGSEQLNDHDTLIITSSLKDIMCLYNIGLKIDYVAPDSETTMIDKNILKALYHKYKRILTLFDNDDAGFKMAKIYKDKYNFKSIILPLSKDPSDSVKDYGKDLVKKTLIQLL